MKKLIGLFSTLVISGSVIPLVAQPALACSANYNVVQASQNTRLYRNDSLGFSLDIPANYRTIARNDGTIEIVDPATFEFVECVARSAPRYGVITWNYARASISSWPIFVPGRNLREIMRNEGIRIPADNVMITFENGKEMIVIAGLDETEVGPQGEDVYRLYAYFRSFDGTKLVVINGVMRDDVFNRILGSIVLE